MAAGAGRRGCLAVLDAYEAGLRGACDHGGLLGGRGGGAGSDGGPVSSRSSAGDGGGGDFEAVDGGELRERA
jgi:hypothetical protein